MSTAPDPNDPKPPEPVPPPPVAPTPAIPGIGPTGNEPPRPDPAPVATRPPTGAAPKLFLAATGVALLAWLAWLSATALNKSRDPVVSRAQAAVAPIPVVAKVKVGKDGKPDANVEVLKPLTAGGPKEKAALLITNLPAATGFGGDGEYLLLLAPEPNAFLPDDSPVFQLATVRTAETDPPVIYRWTADVEKQAERLYRGK